MTQEYQPGLITITGIDGTGKTTTTKAVSQLMEKRKLPVVNYDEYEKTAQVQNPYRAFKAEVKKEPADEQFLFFLLSAFWHSSQIERLINEEDKIVVKSRYVVDVAANYTHLGVTNAEHLTKLIPFLQPSLQVILILDELERQKRILSRSVIEEQDLIKKEPGTRAWFFEKYLLDKSNLIHPETRTMLIDTTRDSVNKISLRIAQAFLGEI